MLEKLCTENRSKEVQYLKQLYYIGVKSFILQRTYNTEIYTQYFYKQKLYKLDHASKKKGSYN